MDIHTGQNGTINNPKTGDTFLGDKETELKDLTFLLSPSRVSIKDLSWAISNYNQIILPEDESLQENIFEKLRELLKGEILGVKILAGELYLKLINENIRNIFPITNNDLTNVLENSSFEDWKYFFQKFIEASLRLNNIKIGSNNFCLVGPNGQRNFTSIKDLNIPQEGHFRKPCRLIFGQNEEVNRSIASTSNFDSDFFESLKLPIISISADEGNMLIIGRISMNNRSLLLESNGSIALTSLNSRLHKHFNGKTDDTTKLVKPLYKMLEDIFAAGFPILSVEGWKKVVSYNANIKK